MPTLLLVYPEKVCYGNGLALEQNISYAKIGQGLNVEQRKRLTIGVELAAKPSLLLFLDEPTSGKQNQSSYGVATCVIPHVHIRLPMNNDRTISLCIIEFLVSISSTNFIRIRYIKSAIPDDPSPYHVCDDDIDPVNYPGPYHPPKNPSRH